MEVDVLPCEVQESVMYDLDKLNNHLIAILKKIFPNAKRTQNPEDSDNNKFLKYGDYFNVFYVP